MVFKTAGDLGGSVVGEAQQKVLNVLQSAAGKVLVIDEAYNLNDGLYGKQAAHAVDSVGCSRPLGWLTRSFP